MRGDGNSGVDVAAAAAVAVAALVVARPNI